MKGKRKLLAGHFRRAAAALALVLCLLPVPASGGEQEEEGRDIWIENRQFEITTEEWRVSCALKGEEGASVTFPVFTAGEGIEAAQEALDEYGAMLRELAFEHLRQMRRAKETGTFAERSMVLRADEGLISIVTALVRKDASGEAICGYRTLNLDPATGKALEARDIFPDMTALEALLPEDAGSFCAGFGKDGVWIYPEEGDGAEGLPLCIPYGEAGDFLPRAFVYVDSYRIRLRPIEPGERVFNG